MNHSIGLQFTCITCTVGFQNADLQRDHYKTDWHRYNLKRKVASLPPVTKADFEGRLAKHAADQAKANKISSNDYCVACSKNFSTDKAYNNHIKSKKHIEAAKKFEMKDNKVDRLIYEYDILGGQQFNFTTFGKFFSFMLISIYRLI